MEKKNTRSHVVKTHFPVGTIQAVTTATPSSKMLHVSAGKIDIESPDLCTKGGRGGGTGRGGVYK